MMIARKKAVIAAIITAAAGLGAGAYLVYSAGGRAGPDFAGRSAEQIAAYLDSNEFKGLDPNTRREYRRRAFEKMFTKTVDGYFATPVEQRTAYLDGVIDRMQQMRGRFGPGPDDARREWRRRGPRGEKTF